MLPIGLLLAGCPEGGGDSEGREGTGAIPAVIYTANGNSNSVSGFTIGATGALTATNPATVAASNSRWLTVSRDGQLLYVANEGNHTISKFSINSVTGVLASIGTPTTVPGTTPTPRGIAITPNRQYLYVANVLTAEIAGFSIGTGGALAPTSQSTISAGVIPRGGIAVSPNGQFLYVADTSDGRVQGFSIGANGALTSVGTPSTLIGPCAAEDMAIDRDSSFLFVVCSNVRLVFAYAIAGNGSLTAATPTSSFLTGTIGGESPQRLTLSRNGSFLYVTNRGTNEVATFTIGSGGQLTRTIPNASTGASSSPVGITIDPTGQFLYVANSGTNEVVGFSIGTNGTLPSTPSVTVSVSPNIPVGIATPGRP